jgi:aminopeptidase N
VRIQRYASEIGPKIQAFFEDYFQIPFPLPKQDMIAIPDFAAGLFSIHSI